jgi:hypothetical protein
MHLHFFNGNTIFLISSSHCVYNQLFGCQNKHNTWTHSLYFPLQHVAAVCAGRHQVGITIPCVCFWLPVLYVDRTCNKKCLQAHMQFLTSTFYYPGRDECTDPYTEKLAIESSRFHQNTGCSSNKEAIHECSSQQRSLTPYMIKNSTQY